MPFSFRVRLFPSTVTMSAMNQTRPLLLSAVTLETKETLLIQVSYIHGYMVQSRLTKKLLS